MTPDERHALSHRMAREFLDLHFGVPRERYDGDDQTALAQLLRDAAWMLDPEHDE